MARKEQIAWVFGVAAFAAACAWIAWRMPVFNHVDEREHVDYVVKMVRGEAHLPTARLDQDVARLSVATSVGAQIGYWNAATVPPALETELARTSYEGYHPPLYYWLAAKALRPVIGKGAITAGQVRALRLGNVLMVVAARVLVLLVLLRLGRQVALAGAPFLLFFVPVDALRVANDALVMLAGAGAVWLAARPAVAGERGGALTLLGVGAAAAVAVATKATGALFVLPALAAVWALKPREQRCGAWAAVAAMVPAAVIFGLFVLGNWRAGAGLTGTAHLGDGFPAAGGLSAGKFIPTAQGWLDFFDRYLLVETRVRALRGGQIYKLSHLVTLSQVGWLAALGFALVSGRGGGELGERLGLTPRAKGAARGLVLAGLATVAWAVAATAVLEAGVGRVFWSGRQFYPVEALVAGPAAVGWAWLTAGPGAARRWLRRALWLAGAGVMALVTWRYMRF